MTRWDWTWEEPEVAAEPTPAPGSSRIRTRRVLALTTTAALAAAMVAIALAVLSSGNHPRAASPATLAAAGLHQRFPRTRGADGPAIDALVRRQPVVFEGGRHRREVALTFDDGPGPYTHAILAELRRLRVHATFFVIGTMERYFAAGTRSALHLGHAIGDHTETHPLMARLPLARQQSEIVDQTEWMSRLRVPYPRLFRPPYGSYDATTLAALRPLHMLLVLWSTDTRDYTRPGVAAIVRHALAGARPGAIILLHDGGGDRAETVAALPLIVRGLRRRHLHPVTVARLLHDDPPPPGQRVPQWAVTEGATPSVQPGG
jgi:peptidoglycan-N-acetylglucosamine deacetylase